MANKQTKGDQYDFIRKLQIKNIDKPLHNYRNGKTDNKILLRMRNNWKSHILFYFVGMQNGTNILKDSVIFPYKVNILIPYGLAIYTP